MAGTGTKKSIRFCQATESPHTVKKLNIIRNVGFRLDAGRVAKRLFGKLGSAGGHKSAARAEIPISALPDDGADLSKISEYDADKIKKR